MIWSSGEGVLGMRNSGEGSYKNDKLRMGVGGGGALGMHNGGGGGEVNFLWTPHYTF